MAEYRQRIDNITSLSKDIKIAFITAQFNSDYTHKLQDLSSDYIRNHWFHNINFYKVPGAFEIPAMIENIAKDYDLIVNLWVVVRGATTHYDYVCNETARGIMNLSIKYPQKAIIFGLLTCENFQQVEERINENLAISSLNLLAEKKRIWK